MLIVSRILKPNEKISGYVGPAFDNVPKCYKYKYICKGYGLNILNCLINKNDQDKVEYKGKYTIYDLEGYSYNPIEISNSLNYFKKERKIKNTIEYFFEMVVIFYLLIYIKFIKTKNFSFYK